MIERNRVCGVYEAAARHVGFTSKEVSKICGGCSVPCAYGRRRRVEFPDECGLFNAIVTRFAKNGDPFPVSPRPCDTLPDACREYIAHCFASGQGFAYVKAKELCPACSGKNPGDAGCAFSAWLKDVEERRNKKK